MCSVQRQLDVTLKRHLCTFIPSLNFLPRPWGSFIGHTHFHPFDQWDTWTIDEWQNVSIDLTRNFLYKQLLISNSGHKDVFAGDYCRFQVVLSSETKRMAALKCLVLLCLMAAVSTAPSASPFDYSWDDQQREAAVDIGDIQSNYKPFSIKLAPGVYLEPINADQAGIFGFKIRIGGRKKRSAEVGPQWPFSSSSRWYA